MPKGGYREGAGRKRGIMKNRRNTEIAIRASAEGITPLEVMLKTMRVLWDKAQPPETVAGGDGELDLEMARQAIVVAGQVAPYIHPRVAPREAPPEKPPEKPQIDVQESARRIAFTLAMGSQKAIEHKAA